MTVLSAMLPLVRSPEDLASHALRHVLDSSVHARTAFNGLLDLPASTRWTTQHVLPGDSAGRPDLAGHNGEHLAALVEAKFEAGLTEGQPLVYLDALPEGGRLAALVPQVRVDYLTAELLRRCRNRDHTVETEGRHHTIAEAVSSRRWTMIVVTWDEVLGHLLRATDQPDARAARDDLVQLQDLVNTVQDRLWTPVSSEELTSRSIPQLLVQVVSLVGDLRDPLGRHDFLPEGRMVSWVSGGIGLPVKRQGDQARYLIRTDWRLWRDEAPTPLWLAIHWEDRSRYDPLLSGWLHQIPLRAAWASHWNTPGAAIPLYLSPGADRDVLMADLATQIVERIDEVERLIGRR